MSTYIITEIESLRETVKVKLNVLEKLIIALENTSGSDVTYNEFTSNMVSRSCCDGFYLPKPSLLELP